MPNLITLSAIRGLLFRFLLVVPALYVTVFSSAFAADFDAEVQDVWLSPSTVYQGDTADVYARFKNLSSLSGPFGGTAQFDLRIIIYPPSGSGTYRCTSIEPASGDSYEFSPSQTKSFYWNNYTFSQTGQYTVKAEIWQNNANPTWSTSSSTRFDYRQESFTINVQPNSSPDRPSFHSVPSARRLYPYTYPNSPDDTDGPYEVTVDFTDPDGRSDLQHVYLQLQGSGTDQTIMYYNLSSVQQWSGEGDHLRGLSASKSTITDGYRVTFSFELKGTWTPSTDVDFEAWALDDSDAESSHRSYNWNGIYDNVLEIYDARKTTLVDNDGDGYYSSVRIEADADTSVSSRTVKMILYRRDSAAGGSGADIWNTGDYTTSGSSTDYKGTSATVTSRGVYDFAWELYDPDWYIDNIWYDVESDISNIPMEPASEDTPNAAPGQPSFNSAPSSAKLYPYTSAPTPNSDNIAGPYTVTVDYTDPNGRSDLQHVYLQIQGDGAPQTIMYYDMTTPQQWDGEGDHLHAITASKSTITDGYRVTFTFQVDASWTPSKNVDFEAWAQDQSDVEGTHRAHDWNGIYDNGLTIFNARKTALVDNDGDGYYSSVHIEADADTSVSSRTVHMVLYRRDSAAGGSGGDIWNTGDYMTSGTATDYRGTDCTVSARGVYDFAWELYDPSWYIGNIWYDVDTDISNLPMEPASEDATPADTPVPISPPDGETVTTGTPGFEWSAFSGSGQTQAGYQLRVRRDTPTAWSFAESKDWGEPPSGWVDESSAGSSHTYRNTMFDGRNCLHMKTTGGTTDRVKVRTTTLFREGTYDWDVFVPAIDEPGAASSIGAFLYSPESSGDLSAREVDFEIGYGKATERMAYSIPTGKLMCYMTVQRDDSSGTPHSTDAVAIDPASWYTLRLVLSPGEDGKYTVQWFIKKQGESFVESRSAAACSYGRNDTTFYVYSSLENLAFIGDFTPTTDKHAYFDHVSVSDTIVYDTGFVADTGSNTHQYSPGTYSGIDPVTGTLRASDALLDGNDYHWHVRYRGSSGVWTAWSADSPGDYQAFSVDLQSAPTDIDLSSSSVAENEPSGTIVGTLSTTDPDAGDTFTYSLASGTGDTNNGSFTIAGDQLKSAASFDYETKNNYSIRIRTTDQGNLWFEKVFSILVEDIPEILKGDINNDGNVDLDDAIIAFRLLVGLQSQEPINLLADVNDDGKIGMEEVIYILQKTSGLRQ